MKNAGALSVAVCACLVLLSTGACGQVEIRADARVASAYVWRGRVLNDEAVLQPSLTVSSGPLSFNAWGSIDLTSVTGRDQRQRMDLTGDYTFSDGPHFLTAGATAFLYPDNDEADTQEWFLRYALNTAWVPSLTVRYDFGEIEGGYATLGLAHSFDVGLDTCALDVGISASGGDEDYVNAVFTLPGIQEDGSDAFVPGDAALLDIVVRAALPVFAGKNVEITPEISYMILGDDDISDAMDAAGLETDEVVYSLNVGIFF